MRQAIAVMVPAAVTAIFLSQATDTGQARLLAGLGSLIILPLILHRVWRFAFPTYRAWSDRSMRVREEIVGLQKRIAAIFERYRERQKGELFKQAYDLTGRSVRDLEEALSVGMFRERCEVFVTAFIRHGVAVRVTASIGSPFRCSAADNPTKWKEHFERLGCDEIRQYHNHPVHNGNTRPSPTDVKASASLKALLGPYGPKLRSLIICWNAIREWKVFEYDESGRYSLHFEFDAAV
jgi:hypothetical protein